VGELTRALDIEGPCIHSGGFGVIRIEPYDRGAHFRLAASDAPEIVSSHNYRPKFLTSAVINSSGRTALCPEHVLSSCLLLGMTGFCITRMTGPYEFPVGPRSGSYVELLLDDVGVPTEIPAGVRIEGDISMTIDSKSHLTAVRSSSARIDVSWQGGGYRAMFGIGRNPVLADILSIGSSRSFVLSTDVARLQRQGRLLGAKDADRWLQLLTEYEFSEEILVEWARHKTYDFLGDMSPLGGMPIGMLKISQPGHAVNDAVRNVLTSLSAAD
jgi:UDP-3-O-acyl-N-acetylglucosamine deacetylase